MPAGRQRLQQRHLISAAAAGFAAAIALFVVLKTVGSDSEGWVGGGTGNSTTAARLHEAAEGMRSRLSGAKLGNRTAVRLRPKDSSADSSTTMTAGEEPVESGPKERTVEKDPRDTSWQQFAVRLPAFVEQKSNWEGNGFVIDAATPPLQRMEDALRAALKQWDTPEGITVENVEQMYCSLGPTSLRVQVINNVGYIVGEVASKQQGRHHKLKIQIQDTLERWRDRMPNADFVIWTDDSPAPKPFWEDPPSEYTGPRESTCGTTWGPLIALHRTREGQETVGLVPDDTFSGDAEAGLRPWAEELRDLRDWNLANPWATRPANLVFRGSPSTAERKLVFESQALRDKDIADIVAVGGDPARAVKHSVGYTAPKDQCNARYMLHLEGAKHSGVLKYALACGAAVLWPRDEKRSREEFWHLILEDGKNVMVLPPVDTPEAAAGLLERVAAAEGAANDTRRLARRAGAAPGSHLRYAEDVLEYWHRVFEVHAQLSRFELQTPHPDAVPLTESIARGEAFGSFPPARTCNTCPAAGLGAKALPAADPADVGPVAATAELIAPAAELNAPTEQV